MSVFSSSPKPAPPYSVGQVGFTRPMPQPSLNTSIGKRDSRSHSAAIGVMRSFVKRRAVSISALCSSPNEKSTTSLLLHSLALPRELGAHRPRAEDVAGDRADHERERD